MVKTTIYLTEELKEKLARLSASEGRSEAELIRDAVRKALEDRLPPKPTVPLSERGLGDPTIAERTDELLEGFGAK
jgi:Arc/MetJ-type ribon-helix-helix transcriptional regulator